MTHTSAEMIVTEERRKYNNYRNVGVGGGLAGNITTYGNMGG